MKPHGERIPQPSQRSANEDHSGIRRTALEKRRDSARGKYGTIQNEIDALLTGDLFPTVIGMGGEHLVVEVSERDMPEKLRDVVIKVNYRQTIPYLHAVIGGDPNQIDQAMEDMEDEIKDRRALLSELREYFGFDAVPAQKMLIRDVPVSSDLIKKMDPSLEGVNYPLPYSIPALVNVQRRFDLPENGEGDTFVSLTGYYPEKIFFKHVNDRKNADRRYDIAHDTLVGKHVNAKPEEVKKCVLDLYPELGMVSRLVSEDLKYAEEDREFTRALRKTVKAMIAFSRETLVVLDLAGRNNVVLIKNSDDWELKMLDALPLEDTALTSLQEVIDDVTERGRDDEEYSLSYKEVGQAFNPLNTVRVINALALLAGADERIELEGLKEIPASAWRHGFAARY